MRRLAEFQQVCRHLLQVVEVVGPVRRRGEDLYAIDLGLGSRRKHRMKEGSGLLDLLS
ncbi:MAG: hypothetical protein M0R74_18085 [Dehalococcoidia bacterium]|nr:hypothetical protein [Dehalococcoidia bacterium]